MYTLPNKYFLPSFLPSCDFLCFARHKYCHCHEYLCPSSQNYTVYTRICDIHVSEIIWENPWITEDTIDMIEERRTVTQLPQKSDEYLLRYTIAHNAVQKARQTDRESTDRHVRQGSTLKKNYFQFSFFCRNSIYNMLTLIYSVILHRKTTNNITVQLFPNSSIIVFIPSFVKYLFSNN